MFFLLCLVIILSGLMPITAFAEMGDIDKDGYMEINNTEKGMRYIKTKFIEDRGDYVVIWEKSVPKGKTLKEYNKVLKINNFGYFLTLKGLHKKHKQIMNIKIFAYNTSGNIIDSIEYPPKWEEVVPDSLGDTLYQLVMIANELQEQQANQ